MTVLTGDCRQLMPARGSFDMIFADPPYGGNSLGWDRRVDGWLPRARTRISAALPLGGDTTTVSGAEVER